MPSFRHAFLLFALIAGPKPAWAAAHSASLTLPAGARIQVAALVDGFTVGLQVDGLEARQLERALLRLRAEKIEVWASRGRKSLAYLQFAERVVAADARLGKRTRKQASQVHLQITTESPRDVMLAHVLDVPLPVPRSLEGDALARADQAFVSKRLGAAELMLEQLKESGMQRAWVMLRLADLAVFHDKLEQACSYYNEAQADGGMRTASTLAALRARVLGCRPPRGSHRLAEGQTLATTEMVDWALLLRRTGRDDPIGRRMGQEARWALAYERDPKVLADVVGLSGPAYGQHLDRPLRESLQARLLRRSAPFALATHWVRGAALGGHPEAFDLALLFGLAWCALDAPSGWQAPLSASKSWLRLSKAERARLVQEVSSCALLAEKEQTTAKLLPPGSSETSKPAAHLALLKQRLALAQRALRQQLASAAP